jgi:hypothetical protein
VYEGLVIGLPLASSIFKHLLQQPIIFKDLKSFKPSVYKQMKKYKVRSLRFPSSGNRSRSLIGLRSQNKRCSIWTSPSTCRYEMRTSLYH